MPNESPVAAEVIDTYPGQLTLVQIGVLRLRVASFGPAGLDVFSEHDGTHSPIVAIHTTPGEQTTLSTTLHDAPADARGDLLRASAIDIDLATCGTDPATGEQVRHTLTEAGVGAIADRLLELARAEDSSPQGE